MWRASLTTSRASGARAWVCGTRAARVRTQASRRPPSACASAVGGASLTSTTVSASVAAACGSERIDERMARGEEL